MIRVLSWLPGVYPSSINGLPLPNSYITLERMGRWRPRDLEILETVFGEESTNPCFYERDYIGTEKKNLCERISDDEYFVGKPDKNYSPGNVNPKEIIFIGDLGIDRPIALDYRINFYEPRVVYLRSTSDGSRWIEVAESFAGLARRLKLTKSTTAG